LLAMFYPSAMWRMRTFLYVRDGEPTDFYIFMSFISGIVLVVAAFITIFAILL